MFKTIVYLIVITFLLGCQSFPDAPTLEGVPETQKPAAQKLLDHRKMVVVRSASGPASGSFGSSNFDLAVSGIRRELSAAANIIKQTSGETAIYQDMQALYDTPPYIKGAFSPAFARQDLREYAEQAVALIDAAIGKLKENLIYERGPVSRKIPG